jgi:hypothetical protein
VLFLTIGITLGAGVFFGLAPALAFSRVNPGAALASRTTTGPGAATIRRTLTIAEVTLAVVLLVGAGLLIRSFMNLTSVELGFAPDGIVIGRMSLQGTSAENADTRQRLIEQGLARIRELPGVTAVAVSNSIPIETGLNLAMTRPRARLSIRPRAVDWRYVSPDYFSLFQIDTRAGMTFTDDHRAGRPLVAVVNEAFARTYFGRVDATGQTITVRQRGTTRDHRSRRGREGTIGCRASCAISRWGHLEPQAHRRSTCPSPRPLMPLSSSRTGSST